MNYAKLHRSELAEEFAPKPSRAMPAAVCPDLVRLFLVVGKFEIGLLIRAESATVGARIAGVGGVNNRVPALTVELYPRGVVRRHSPNRRIFGLRPDRWAGNGTRRLLGS